MPTLVNHRILRDNGQLSFENVLLKNFNLEVYGKLSDEEKKKFLAENTLNSDKVVSVNVYDRSELKPIKDNNLNFIPSPIKYKDYSVSYIGSYSYYADQEVCQYDSNIFLFDVYVPRDKVVVLCVK